jgi:hypothetical protein
VEVWSCTLPIISVAAGLQFVTTGHWSLTVQTLLPVAAAVTGLVVIAIIVIFALRRTPAQEKEMMRREDELISDVPTTRMSLPGGCLRKRPAAHRCFLKGPLRALGGPSFYAGFQWRSG